MSKTYPVLGAAAVGLFVLTAPCLADEVTTTTTTTTPAPAPGVSVGAPGVVGVQIGAPPTGCTTRNTTQTNTDTGQSRSVTRSDC
jgi:hypothetical protein